MDKELISLLTPLFKEETIVSLLLSAPKDKKQGVVRMTVRPLTIKGQMQYQITDHYKDKAVHRNLSKEACQREIITLFKEAFKQGIIYTKESDYHIQMHKDQSVSIVKKAPTKSLGALSHNKPKNYLLEEGSQIPFLIALDIMNSEGKVFASKRDKFRQINRFLELVSDVLPAFKGKEKIRIVDFGCGKAYLTFALYHYLHYQLEYEVEMVGLDLKEEVIESCRALAKKLEYTHLKFFCGDINTYSVDGKVDLMITLHACDTATDAALEKAVRSRVEVILSVPCCQHELFSQLSSKPLTPLLEHGILKERFTALVTDAARGKLLELLGYSVQIVEFIDMEHTPKNILIRAVRKNVSSVNPLLVAEYLEFKKLLQIEPSLEKRFVKELALGEFSKG